MIGNTTTTNLCESMNYLHELHCDKIHSWGNSAPVRSAVAVLRKNHPLTYQKEVIGICDVDELMISPQIELRSIDNYLLNQYKRTPKARKIKKNACY
ncbi:hypothetical protein M9Y10_040298 [Tritrichomonas musculus]|uniref:Glycosyltransferase family 92 protein n=1 Tax=Tritrichomonas musculus TaxID=1915356 RepID=A0ABR2GPP6_9EUKA